MAELLNRIPTNLTEYPNSFKRQGAFPLEAYSVFYTLADAEAYASTNAISYVGQTIAVVNTNAEDASVVDSVTLYIIADAAGTLQEVGNAAYDDTALANRVSEAEATIAEQGGRLTTVEGKVNAFFAVSETPDEVIDTLEEIQKYIADDKTGVVGMLADIGANAAAIATLTGEGDGSVAKAISTAIADQASTDAANYATQAALAEVNALAAAAAVKADVETALAGKVDNAALDDYYLKTQVYSKEEIQERLDRITGTNSETATSVANALADHKAENVASFTAVEKKQGEQDTAIQANADAIELINDETDGIYARAVAAAAAEAKNKVDNLANTTVAQNTADIAANTAKFADYSTTEQVATMIANIDYSALETDISDNATAISDEVTRAKAREDEIAGLVSANATAIGDNAANIAALDTAIKAVIDDKDGTTLNSIKDLATWVEEHNTDVLPVIQANTDAIALLNDKTGKEGSVQQIVADAIAAIPAIPYATGTTAGLVKASEEIDVSVDGVMGINQVSTDKLVQGNSTLVLFGGTSATVTQLN